MSRCPTDTLAAPVATLRGAGPRRVADLEAAGIRTIEDLLLALPRRYECRTQPQPIASLEPGTTVSITGCVVACRLRPTRRPRFRIVELVVEDGTGRVRATFMNQAYLAKRFEPGQRVALHGRYARGRGGLAFINPDHERLDDSPDPDAPPAGGADPPAIDTGIQAGRIVPVYPAIGNCPPKMRRRWVHEALARLARDDAGLPDPLPAEVRRAHGFPARPEALRVAHVPPDGMSLDALNTLRTPAQQRLIFEEFFAFQVRLLRRRREADRRAAPRPLSVSDRIRRAARDILPFRLTVDQRTALRAIVDDLRRPAPMHRLLQGDVGSGKTIVALLGALVVMENGRQVALMSPTEVLAEQQYASVARLLAPSRFAPLLLTGALAPAARRAAAAAIANGSARLVVGTHALVQAGVAFHDLGLAIIDEQHRFGVLQRAALAAKGLHPDLLVMTATPIPRTLAMTAYGDLDVTELRERPPGRQPIATHLWPVSRREEAYGVVRRELGAGHQAFVVHPVVDASETLDLRGAIALAAELETWFPEHRVGLVHGRLPAADRQRTMAAFAAGRIDLLVATTVIEVGVDVPNATVMVIEQAERFGLAQLHQLRGRVGRGDAASICILVHGSDLAEATRTRLDALVETTDGFEIAERDLELRGPGDMLGTRQSGLPLFRVGDLVRDHRLMADARRAAVAWIGGDVDRRCSASAMHAETIGAGADADHRG